MGKGSGIFDSKATLIFDHADVNIQSIRYVLNKDAYMRFISKIRQMGDDARLLVVYHGTAGGNTHTIMENNFSMKKIGRSSGNQGYFGKGIYFGRRAFTALGYNK